MLCVEVYAVESRRCVHCNVPAHAVQTEPGIECGPHGHPLPGSDRKHHFEQLGEVTVTGLPPGPFREATRFPMHNKWIASQHDNEQG